MLMPLQPCPVWLQAAHPSLADSTDLRAFLEDNEGEWQVEVRRLFAPPAQLARRKP
jgi:hypothetical protein